MEDCLAFEAMGLVVEPLWEAFVAAGMAFQLDSFGSHRGTEKEKREEWNVEIT